MPYTTVQSNQGYNPEPGINWGKVALYGTGAVVGYGIISKVGRSLGRGYSRGLGAARRGAGRIRGAGGNVRRRLRGLRVDARRAARNAAASARYGYRGPTHPGVVGGGGRVSTASIRPNMSGRLLPAPGQLATELGRGGPVITPPSSQPMFRGSPTERGSLTDIFGPPSGRTGRTSMFASPELEEVLRLFS